MITDDRGLRVPLVAHEPGVALGSDERSARLRAASAEPRGRPTREEIIKGIFYGVVVLPVLVVASLAPAWLAFRTSLPTWAQIGIMSLTGVLPALVTVFVARRVGARRIARTYVKAGLCASCGYELRGTHPSEDGRHTCPECGAGWLIPAP